MHVSNGQGSDITFNVSELPQPPNAVQSSENKSVSGSLGNNLHTVTKSENPLIGEISDLSKAVMTNNLVEDSLTELEDHKFSSDFESPTTGKISQLTSKALKQHDEYYNNVDKQRDTNIDESSDSTEVSDDYEVSDDDVASFSGDLEYDHVSADESSITDSETDTDSSTSTDSSSSYHTANNELPNSVDSVDLQNVEVPNPSDKNTQNVEVPNASATEPQAPAATSDLKVSVAPITLETTKSAESIPLAKLKEQYKKSDYEVATSPAKHLQDIMGNLKGIAGKDAEGKDIGIKFNIKTGMERTKDSATNQKGKYIAEPYTHPNYPGQILYKVNVTFTVQVKGADDQPIPDPSGEKDAHGNVKNLEIEMNRSFLTTFTDPETALKAVHATKNKLVEMAMNDKEDPALLKTTAFQFNFDKNGKVKQVLAQIKDATGKTVTESRSLDVKPKEKTYERGFSNENEFFKTKKTTSYEGQAQVRLSKEDKLHKGNIKIKGSEDMLSMLEKTGGDINSYMSDVRDSIRKLNEDLEEIKGQLKQPRFSLIGIKLGSKNSDNFQLLLNDLKTSNNDEKILTKLNKELNQLNSELSELEKPDAAPGAAPNAIESKKAEIDQKKKDIAETQKGLQDLLNMIGRMQDIRGTLNSHKADLENLNEKIIERVASPSERRPLQANIDKMKKNIEIVLKKSKISEIENLVKEDKKTDSINEGLPAPQQNGMSVSVNGDLPPVGVQNPQA